YSSRRNPSRITGTTCFLPIYPTIPHIERLKMETSELTRNKLPLRLVARDLPRSGRTCISLNLHYLVARGYLRRASYRISTKPFRFDQGSLPVAKNKEIPLISI